MTHLYIATPVHGWEITGMYWATMEGLKMECASRGWQLTIKPWFGVSDLIRRRNVDVHRMLCTDATHLITFDADQSTTSETFVKLVESPYGICAAPVHKKHDNPTKEAWNFHCVDPDQMVIEGDYLQVDTVGSGCMCVTRDTLLKMAAVYPYFMIEGQPVPQLYAKDLIDPEGLFPYELSEDYTFCQRAKKIGIPPWVWVPGRVQHLGSKVYEGQLHV